MTRFRLALIIWALLTCGVGMLATAQVPMTGAGKGTPSVGAFSPTSIAGLQIWLDAADAATVHQTSGAVTQWDDKSGNGKNALQATTGIAPNYTTAFQNGKNVLNYKLGTPQYMDVATFVLSQSFTIFGAARSDTSGSGAFLLDDVDGTNRVAILANNAVGSYEGFAGSALNGSSDQTGKFATFVIVFAGGSSQLFVNGSSEAGPGAIGANNFTTMRLGNRFDGTTAGLNGYFGDFGVYNSVISGTNLTNLSSYLTTKWAPP